MRATPEIPPTLAGLRTDLRTLGDRGDEGEADTITITITITVAFKTPTHAALTDIQQLFNHTHNAIRAIGEGGHALLKMTFRALCHISLDPWRIGKIVAAALVLLHLDHHRTI